VNRCAIPAHRRADPSALARRPQRAGALGPLRSNKILLDDDETAAVEDPGNVVVVSSSSTQESNPDPPSPIVTDLVARVRGLWPDEPLIERRVAELAAQGEAEAALAVEYAAVRKAKGLAYAVSTRKRWARDGYTLAECQAEVHAKAPRTPPGRPAALPPAHVAPKSPSQDVDPVMADLMHQFNRARGPRKSEIAAMMARRSAELEAPCSL
jgi:hypothetical protein